MAKQSKNERSAGLEAARIPLNLEALEQRILLSNPGIGYLSDSPDPVNEGSTLTLVAHTVTELNGGTGTITGVQFYRSTDSTADPLTDTLLGSGSLSGANDYVWSGPATWAPDTYYYYAIATDSDGAISPAALSTGRVNALPVITSLTGSPEPTGPGSLLTLTANGVSDADGTVASVQFYHDTNGDGILETGTDLLLGTDYDGQDGWSINNVPVTWSTGDYLARAVDNDGAYSAVVTGHVDQRPVIALLQNNPNPAVAGQLVTFLASGVSDPDGTVTDVAIWRDQDGDGSFNALKDQLLGNAVDQGGGNWSLTVLDNWQPGVTPLYFAIATDNSGFQGLPTATLNQNPSIDGIQSDQTTIALGSDVDLTAVGVQDLDGSIANVVFSVNSPSTWWPGSNSPTGQHQDGSLSGGWTWPNLNVDWTITDIQQADFNRDGSTDLAVSVNTTAGAGPDFVVIMTNNGAGKFNTTSMVTLYDDHGQDAIESYDPVKLAIGDFNEDGSPDIVVADHGRTYQGGSTNVYYGRVSVILNDGTGGFSSYTDFLDQFVGDLYTVVPDNIVVGDFSGDGHLDLAVYATAQDTPTPFFYGYEMPILLGDGAGNFTLDRIYDYGTSMGVSGPSVPAGYTLPSTTQDVQGMLSTDLDQDTAYGGTDIATIGQNGLQIYYNYTNGVTAPPAGDFNYFAPGNVIGRAFNTGITAGQYSSAAFHYIYRTGEYYNFAQGDAATDDDFYLLNLTDTQMYQVSMSAGDTLTGRMDQVLPQGTDPSDMYIYIFDSSGNIVSASIDSDGNPINYYTNSVDADGNALADTEINFTASATDNYYVAIAGAEMTDDTATPPDYVNPFTGYWENGDTAFDGGADVQYTFVLRNDGLGTDSLVVPRGDSIAAADFMEDDYYNNVGNGAPTILNKDLDLAIGNSLTGEVQVLFGGLVTDQLHQRMRYGNYADGDNANSYSGQDFGGILGNTYVLGHAPISIATYNINSDTDSQALGDPNFDWHQGSVGVHSDEVYNDIVTVNSDGTVSVLVNTGDQNPFEYPDGFGTLYYPGSRDWELSFDYTGQFDDTTLGYTMANSPNGGPLQNVQGLAVGDFNNDGLPDFAGAEQYDVALLNQAYPFFSSDPLDNNMFADELPGANLAFGFAGRYSLIPDQGQLGVTYYAQAFDNLYGYPYNEQYEGYSNLATLTLPMNQRPLIWSLTGNAQQLGAGDTFTLTANGVQDLDGAVSQVQFYEGSVEPDHLLATDRNGNDGWTYTGTLDDPNAVFYAVAVDNNGAAGNAVATHLNVAPTVDQQLLTPGSIKQGDTLLLYATGVTGGANATTNDIRKVEFFLDSNYDGVYEPGTDRFLGRGVQTAPGTWLLENWLTDYTDPHNPTGYYALPTVAWAAGQRTYFAFAQDDDGNWSAAGQFTQDVQNLPPEIGSITTDPAVAVLGQDITLTATGVDDLYGQVASVSFYVGDDDPVDLNHQIDPTNAANDTLLGVDQSAVGGWSLTTTVTWSGQPSYTYWAVVTDNNGAVTSASITRTADQPPTIDGAVGVPPLAASPEPVAQGTTLTLTATGVSDPDAGDSITDVQFYRDSNGNGSFDPGVDQLLSNYVGGNVTYVTGNVDGSGTYTWTGPASFPEGTQTYFVRAQDSSGAWSEPAVASGRVQNAIPTIGSLNVTPDPATQGDTLTLTAAGVSDANGTIAKVEFYVDSNGNSVFEPGTDLLLGTALVGSGGTYQVTAPVNWAAGSRLYFARAQDNEGAWSEPATFSGSVNARPVIGSFAADPSPYVPGDLLTLTASNVTDSDGTIASVKFYRDTNGDGVFELAQDALVGSGTVDSSGTSWSLTFVDNTAVRHFFAVATDNSGGNSVAASLDLQRRPTIDSLTAAPSSVTAQQQLILTANNVNDVDGTIDSVKFYRDDGDGVYDPATDYLLGIDTSAAGGWSVSVSPDWGGGNATFYAVARDNEGNFSPTTAPHVPVATAYVDYSPVINDGLLFTPPDVVNRGTDLLLTASNVTDQDSNVTEVDFYRDANGDGVLDPQVDQLLGTGTQNGNDWSLTVHTGALPLGDQTFFAQAIDDQGALSQPAEGTERINGLPLVGALQVTPQPGILGLPLTLTASGVADPDGTINLATPVNFYRDGDINGNGANGVWDSSDVQFSGTVTELSSGVYQLVVYTSGPNADLNWTAGNYTYFAKAVDNDGAEGPALKTVGTMITGSLPMYMDPDPANDTGVSQTDGITSNTQPYIDFQISDYGTLWVDWNNDNTVDGNETYAVPAHPGSTTVTPSIQVPNPLADGDYTINAQFTDHTGQAVTNSLDITIDTATPATPGAPDLQALSDDGQFNDDDVTGILTSTFNVDAGQTGGSDNYFEFFSADNGNGQNLTQIGGDYESGGTFTLPQPAQAGTTVYYYVKAVSRTGEMSDASDPLAVTYVTAGQAPPAPDLQPGSDSGVSQTDNITNADILYFDTAPGVPAGQDYTVRLWRDGVLVGGAGGSVVDSTVVWDDASSLPDGTYNYTITVLPHTGSPYVESAPSDSLAVHIDRTAPTVTDPNISAVLSVDNGIKGLAEYGDTVRITWDNSASGDNNDDVASVAVDLTQYGAPGQAAMFDDGTHGDATAGDGIWTLDYTITSTEIATQAVNVAVYATDIAGNVGVGQDTSGIRVRPKLLAQTAWAGFDVSIYDVDGNSDFNPEDIVVKTGKDNSVKSITIGGTGPAEGLGISISGASYVGSIKDARKGPLGQIAFIASDSPIKSIQLQSGMEGYNLNDQVFGELHFAADIDGDGSTTDPTAIYSEGPIGKIQIGGDMMADIWIGGTDPKKGMAVSKLSIGGDFHADLRLLGNAGKLQFGGDIGSGVYVDGSLAGLQMKDGDMLAGAHVFVRDMLSKLQVGGSLLGNASEDQMVQILAGDIGKGQVGGSVYNSRILAGTDLGSDWAVGGTDDAADSFAAGEIGGLKIGGNVVDSLIAAGLRNDNSFLDLSASNVFLAGSSIGKLSINGALTSSAAGPEQPFGIGSYEVGKYKINGSDFSPLVFSET